MNLRNLDAQTMCRVKRVRMQFPFAAFLKNFKSIAEGQFFGVIAYTGNNEAVKQKVCELAKNNIAASDEVLFELREYINAEPDKFFWGGKPMKVKVIELAKN
jgi:hypothetical protein